MPQLLQEAALDIASTMLVACSAAPVPLLQKALELIAVATESDSAGTPPAIGLIELSIKLWKCVLMALRQPLAAELCSALSTLAARLPALISLADELLRPGVQLVDWYLPTPEP